MVMLSVEQFTLKRIFKCFVEAHNLILSLEYQSNPRWRGVGAIEAFISSQADGIEEDAIKSLRSETELCREKLAYAWECEVKELVFLSSWCQKRFKSNGDLEIIFGSIFRSVADHTRVERAKAWKIEFIAIASFVECVDFSSEYIRRIRVWSDELRGFVKEIDKTEGDQRRLGFAVKGLWVAVASIILSNALSIWLNVINNSRSAAYTADSVDLIVEKIEKRLISLGPSSSDFTHTPHPSPQPSPPAPPVGHPRSGR